MRHRLLRAFVTLATFVVVWLVTSPASAHRAPICDPRGATAFASPPQLQDPEASLDVVEAQDCAGETPLDGRHATRGRSGGAENEASPEPLTFARAVLALAPPAARIAAPASFFRGKRPGFRHTLERPPR